MAGHFGKLSDRVSEVAAPSVTELVEVPKLLKVLRSCDRVSVVAEPVEATEMIIYY